MSPFHYLSRTIQSGFKAFTKIHLQLSAHAVAVFFITMTLMRRQQRHGKTRLLWCAILSCPVAAGKMGLEHATPHVCRFRGGDLTRDEEENRKLDEYIEQLVASVDTSEADGDDTAVVLEPKQREVEEEDDEASEEEEEEQVATVVESGEKVEEAISDEEEEVAEEIKVEDPEVAREDMEGSVEEEPVEAEPVEEKEEEEEETKEDDATADHDAEDTVVEIAMSTEQTAQAQTDKKEESAKLSKRKRRAASVADGSNADPEGDKASPDKETPSPPAVAPYRRPNALYRFFLGQGRIGHVIVMACIMVVEWIQTYVPTVVNFITWIFLQLGLGGGGGSASMVDTRDHDETLGMQSKVNAQYAAFVSTDGSTVRGKQQKKQAKRADEKAVEQLRRVGSVKEAKYRHVSLDFMKRHGIGPFHDGSGEMMIGESSSHALTKQSEEEDDSDVDWVVEALSTKTTQDEKGSLSSDDSKVKPSISVGVGSGGPSLRVGVEFELGGSSKKKKKKRRKSVVEAAAGNEPSKKKASAGPRASDRDGGGGIVGRLRSAVGSNIPSSLLGAYPGDAVPTSEAASADGVVALARKYGYGDWSDDEDADGDSPVVTQRNKKTRKTSSGGRTRQKNRSNTSSSSSSLSLGFDFSMGERRSEPPTSSGRRRRSSSKGTDGDRRSTNKKGNTSSISTSTAELLIRTGDSEQRKKLATAEKLVRLPMERTKEVQSRLAEK